ncbi:NAD-dependent succinate-semialdehyde dehydrogenase [Taylorella equigenitalis]|uniref:Putative succinate-semialdehyde dehydrogenase n=1 Tax=Taylorella equigenitalis 14/56 TaxID=1091497 RepID=I7JJN8_9BURK|nr:NAD-dependent succinate-semialdehyde dehydrogenase [Taylorella equigenitalis]ASY30544.1 NAD-dependent succinate-semialdehyde dehydrogenase [Taylorella equigenitalis]ASY37851.1 NAD-dependent succinate-semialdehyde dehydrogenase [Taylorella equigenitalis]ASY42272.1 NAD-dependent succinate-semialdehyde dehydrogenase [Taylorella equigenitalis]KGK32874.1 succinate-semialdehyde dehydrogenase [Taylorella equigenitalis]RBA26087.1 NAD-dependent succinate-semialdehyde dehydrogenase [Taylorella equige
MDKLKNKLLFQSNSYIDGNWFVTDKNFEVTNPASGEVIAHVSDLSIEQALNAINKAAESQKTYKKLVAKDRAKLLKQWYELILENIDDLARIMTIEQGKPLAEAKREIMSGVAYIEWFAEESKRIYGDTIPGPSDDRRVIVTKEPIGLCAAVTPWNFPCSMILRKAAPALAAGCCFILRPSSKTPLTALALASLAHNAGFPAGVFNVITSKSHDIANLLTTDDRIKHFSFTGSTDIGKRLMSQCANTVKRVSLELGGNAPFIIYDDADLTKALDGIIVSKFRNAGQTCACADRIYVQKGIYQDFLEGFLARVKNLKLGSGLDADTTTGPLIDEDALIKIKENVADALSKGAKVEVGGQVSSLGGLFFEPTVLTNVNKDMKVVYEENFGPLAAVIPFETEAEVITMANDTPYGLASYVYTQDLGRVVRTSEELEYGMVGINAGNFTNETAPFGGVKQSGLGREGSKYGIDDYVEIKFILISGI